jgi:hypothetical protein
MMSLERTCRVLVVPLLALVAIAAPRSAGLVLITIDRLQPVAVAAYSVRDVFPLYELQTGWIAEAPVDAVARLQASGVVLRVLDTDRAGKRYFLAVSLAGGDVRGLMPSLGTVTVIEPRVALVAVRGPVDPGEIGPADISFSPLDRPARAPMAFDVAGRDHARPRVAAEVDASDPRIAAIAAAVSRERLAAGIGNLVSFGTRDATTSNCEAAGTSIFDYLRSLGLATQSDHFTFGSRPYSTSNIIATLPGRTDPQHVVIICAHYDSRSSQPETFAPGADDNASGSAAVMEAARVLSSASFDFTVKFIAFSAEEGALAGSRHYAQEARQRGEQIIGVVNLDMIGYVDRAPENVDVAVNAASDWLGSRFTSAAATYATLPSVKQVNTSLARSDNLSFWTQGYPALVATSDLPVTNPHYHTPTDEVETLDLTFATAVSRAAIATVAGLAQPVAWPKAPTGLAVSVYTSMSLFSTATSVYLTWNAVGDAAGYHVYRTSYSHAAYERVTATPVTTISYISRLASIAGPGRTSQATAPVPTYFVVTAVDAQGREGNRSAEVEVNLVR